MSDDLSECAVSKIMREQGLDHEQAMIVLQTQQQKFLETEGWYAHLVYNDTRTPTGCNIHTHGLVETCGHLDFQLVTAVPPEVVGGIFRELVKRIKAGEKFHSGQYLAEIIQRFKVKLVDAWEGRRPVLRIILPDTNGNLDEGEIYPPHDKQYADLH